MIRQQPETLAGHVKVVIIDIEDVPAMDATGLVVLEECLEKLHRRGVFVILAGIQAQPAKVLEQAGIAPAEGRLAFAGSPELAIGIAKARSAATQAG